MKKLFVFVFFTVFCSFGLGIKAQAFDGVIIVNRVLGGAAPVQRWDPVSHTFVAFVQDGQVTATASWGNNGFVDNWNHNTAIDLESARAAYAKGWYSVGGVGGSIEDFLAILDQQTAQGRHPNFGVAWNCKWEAQAFAAGYASRVGDSENELSVIGEFYQNPRFFDPFTSGGSATDAYYASVRYYALASYPPECRREMEMLLDALEWKAKVLNQIEY